MKWNAREAIYMLFSAMRAAVDSQHHRKSILNISRNYHHCCAGKARDLQPGNQRQ